VESTEVPSTSERVEEPKRLLVDVSRLPETVEGEAAMSHNEACTRLLVSAAKTPVCTVPSGPRSCLDLLSSFFSGRFCETRLRPTAAPSVPPSECIVQ
jgi:hypothetical protein